MVCFKAVTGKMILWGYDNDNRPAIYFRPSRQNLEPGIRQVQFVVWGLERMIELMGPGVEYVLIIYTACSARSCQCIDVER